MTICRSLLISAVALSAFVVPASAESSPTAPTTPPTFTRTYYFPPVGLAATETARISAVNIAPTSAKGTKASCGGTISFTDATGAAIGKSTAITNLGTGEIQSGDLVGSGARAEVQGSVQVTITLGPTATPCSLLLTLETFDTASGATHAVVTAAVAGAEPFGFGLNR